MTFEGKKIPDTGRERSHKLNRILNRAASEEATENRSIHSPHTPLGRSAAAGSEAVKYR